MSKPPPGRGLGALLGHPINSITSIATDPASEPHDPISKMEQTVDSPTTESVAGIIDDDLEPNKPRSEHETAPVLGGGPSASTAASSITDALITDFRTAALILLEKRRSLEAELLSIDAALCAITKSSAPPEPITSIYAKTKKANKKHS